MEQTNKQTNNTYWASTIHLGRALLLDFRIAIGRTRGQHFVAFVFDKLTYPRRSLQVSGLLLIVKEVGKAQKLEAS